MSRTIRSCLGYLFNLKKRVLETCLTLRNVVRLTSATLNWSFRTLIRVNVGNKAQYPQNTIYFGDCFDIFPRLKWTLVEMRM